MILNNTINLDEHFLTDKIRQHQEEIHHWLQSHEIKKELPLYSSVDIRDAGYKIAVVDTNLFPAGFNNLCEHGLQDSVEHIKNALYRRMPGCRNILIIAEEHTRNTWYLENIRILQQIIEQAGFNARTASFLDIQPSFCQGTARYVEFDTAQGSTIKIYCLKKILSDYGLGREAIDLIILNNDLSQGIPDMLRQNPIPIYPSLQAGWHSRLKSHHFNFSRALIAEFAEMIDVDPWHFSCLYNVVDKININEEQDRARLTDAASDLLNKIRTVYAKKKIKEKPFIFIKSDFGTYGMGVMPIEDASQIQNLNRKARNKLYKGKSARVIERYILQEGVSTIYNIDHQVSEVCIYQIENNLIGGFYRSHALKTDRENLNSKGMVFKQMCPHSSQYGDCGVHYNINVFDIYRILARIAAMAAHREIIQLEAKK